MEAGNERPPKSVHEMVTGMAHQSEEFCQVQMYQMQERNNSARAAAGVVISSVLFLLYNNDFPVDIPGDV